MVYPQYTLEHRHRPLAVTTPRSMQNQWVAARQRNLGAPPVLDNGVKLLTHTSMSPKDMTMLELAQFTEARIAELLGVPAPLVGLPSGDSLTYSNITSLFDFHDRASLRPKATDGHVGHVVLGAAPRSGCGAQPGRVHAARRSMSGPTPG